MSSKSVVRLCWTIVWRMMSVEMARTAVVWMTIECCVRWCATRCAGSDTAGMTSAESWTSARPTCSWYAVQQAASAASEAASWRLAVEALVERYAPRCYELAGACEWCRMERRTASSIAGVKMIPPPSVSHFRAGGSFYRPHLLAFLDFWNGAGSCSSINLAQTQGRRYEPARCSHMNVGSAFLYERWPDANRRSPHTQPTKEHVFQQV